MELPINRPEKIQLREINPYLTCYLCKGYLIDATAISECLHSFCRSCIIKFLQENSYCPVCEMIINKAKPNLKLDKTLQDIVYKLVPELFLREMTRRKQFYQQYPQIAARVTPEERGEDTERTIFNPQDCISLSLEYVSDDSAPDAIRLPGYYKNGSDPSKQLTAEESQALMKRYLQCPGMCRIEVLKKFVRNKYNVDTNSFHIDILYKKVPLPDHYTLIDIAYIYSWKRNEPMKFFFRITDINKINERFDIFGSQSSLVECIVKPPPARIRNSDRTPSKKRDSNATRRRSKLEKIKSECDNNNGADKGKISDVSGVKSCEESNGVVGEKSQVVEDAVLDGNVASEKIVDCGETDKSESDAKNDETVKVTLEETKIEQNALEKSSTPPTPPPLSPISPTLPPTGSEELENSNVDSDNIPLLKLVEEEKEKQKFLHSVELQPKNSSTPSPSPTKSSPQNSPKSGQKRKNSSPIKQDKGKKPKLDKTKPKPVNGLKSIIENCKIPSSLSITIKETGDNKTPSLPPVKNYIEILKLPDDNFQNKTETTPTKMEFKFCDNDSEQKVDQDLAEIARSLTEKIPMSTTISQIIGPPKPQFPIPTKKSVTCKNDAKKTSNIPKENKVKSHSGFQKIFEESLKKPEEKPDKTKKEKAALNLSNDTNNSNNNNNKRNILEIASQLYKKNKLELEKQTETKCDAVPKVPIPKLSKNNNNTSPNSLKFEIAETFKFGQTLANMHSNALGLNYTISVDQNSTPNKLNGTKPSVKTPELPIETKPGSSSNNNSPKPSPIPNLSLTPPKNSPKHSPKSSPVVKHMYAPVLMDPLKINTVTPPKAISPKVISPKAISPKAIAPKTSCASPKHKASPKSPRPTSSKIPKPSPTGQTTSSPLSPNQILEKYNIQNLPQLTASFNFGLNPSTHMVALQQAMVLKHFEMNRPNWLNMNHAPLVQYEKFLQNLKTNQNHLLGNIKDN